MWVKYRTVCCAKVHISLLTWHKEGHNLSLSFAKQVQQRKINLNVLICSNSTWLQERTIAKVGVHRWDLHPAVHFHLQSQLPVLEVPHLYYAPMQPLVIVSNLNSSASFAIIFHCQGLCCPVDTPVYALYVSVSIISSTLFSYTNVKQITQS